MLRAGPVTNPVLVLGGELCSACGTLFGDVEGRPDVGLKVGPKAQDRGAEASVERQRVPRAGDQLCAEQHPSGADRGTTPVSGDDNAVLCH